jgi:small subunit ribosomal protein S16
MLRIRLTRGGKKRQPHYRVVVAESTSPRDGRYVEQIGYYDPLTNPETFTIEEARALHWLSVGAQPSDAVKRLLTKQGTYDRLGRFHSGESLDELVAEYTGVELPSAAAVEEAVEEVEEVVAEAAAPVAERVSDAVENVVETVSDIAESAQESVSELVENATEAVQSGVAGAVEAVSELVDDAADAVVPREIVEEVAEATIDDDGDAATEDEAGTA